MEDHDILVGPLQTELTVRTSAIPKGAGRVVTGSHIEKFLAVDLFIFLDINCKNKKLITPVI